MSVPYERRADLFWQRFIYSNCFKYHFLAKRLNGNQVEHQLISKTYGNKPLWLYASTTPCCTVPRSKLHSCYEWSSGWRLQRTIQNACRNSLGYIHTCGSHRARYNRCDHLVSSNFCGVESFRNRLSALVRSNAHPQRDKVKCQRACCYETFGDFKRGLDS